MLVRSGLTGGAFPVSQLATENLARGDLRDGIDKLDLPNRADLERELGLPDNQAYFLVTYHPATLSTGNTGTEAEEMLAALDQFSHHRVVLTGVNADTGHDRIAILLTDYAAEYKDRVSLHASLGQRRYLGATTLGRSDAGPGPLHIRHEVVAADANVQPSHVAQ